MKILRKCHNHESQPSRDTKRMRDEKQIKTKRNITYETTDVQIKNWNRGTALERSVEKILGALYQFSLRKHAYSNKTEKFQIKSSDFFFHISAQNIDCGYSLEPPRRGGSNENTQSMFLSRIMKNNVYPCKPQFYYIKVGFKRVSII